MTYILLIIIVKAMFKKQQQGYGERQQPVCQQLANGLTKMYQKGRTLGKGGFAQCFQLISQETGKRYAAKIIEKETLARGKARQKLQSQIMIHKSLRHRHIVKFQHFFEDHQKVYILLQLCCNNTLNELLKRRKVLTEVQVKFYMIQIIQAVKYIHSKKIIHRDLKLGNFFLADGLELKVGDFGLATALAYEGERRKTICGTPNYIAPEILQSKKGHSYEVDVWSLGVIAYALLFGKPPFETNDVKATYEKIKICDYSFPKSNVSQTAKDFISKMLKIVPSQRATIDKLLSDPFLELSQIPKTLPLSTLACPPSKTFVEQIKSNHRAPSQCKVAQNDEFQLGLNSSRTQRQQSKYQCLNGSQRAESFRNNAKSRKSQRSMGSITRTVSTAAILNRKKTTSNLGDQLKIPPSNRCSVWYFQEHSKYGLFYVLTNGIVGMRFNDITCLVSNLSFKKFKYVALKNTLQEIQVQLFDAGQEREALSKKMKIINHFYRELKAKKGDGLKILQKIKEPQLNIYVTAHFNTSSYSLFWLGGSNFHAKFKDDSEVLLQGDSFVYISKDKRQTQGKAQKLNDFEQSIRYKLSHVQNLIKKIKRNRFSQESDQKEPQKKQLKQKVEKQNNTLVQSCSSKLIKPKEKQLVRRQFSSTANLHIQKRPLQDFVSNK